MNHHIEEIIQCVSANNYTDLSKNTLKKIPIPTNISDKFLAFVLCAIFLAFALSIGIISSRPFQWPFNWDPLRDIGIAQTIRDANYPEDPILKGEINWYNPLTGAIIALFGYILDKPLPETCIKIGPFLQLLLPLSVLILAWNRWGPWAGLLTLTYALFARHPFLPEWMYSAYSPWLIAPQWGKTFFFLTIFSFVLYMEQRKYYWAILSGIFLGLGFLTHTAVLIEAVLFIILFSVIKTIQQYPNIEISKAQFFTSVGVPLCVALVISSPYWLPILIRYQFVIRNPYPSLYLTPALEKQNLLSTILKSTNGFTLIGVISFLVFIINRKKADLFWIKIWTLTVLLLLIHQITCQTLYHYGGYTIPTFFPPHHTFMSVHAIIGFWFTYGSLQIAESIVHILNRRKTHYWLQKGLYLLILSLIFLLGITTLVKPIPPLHEIYRGTAENKLVYEVAKFDSAYNWLLNNTSPDDIFLSDETTSIWTIMPAGRKCVYTMMFYMNPYCDISPRIDLFNNIWNALREQRYPVFLVFCKQNNIQYILLTQKDPHKLLIEKISKIQPCYEDPEVVIYKIL